MWHVMVRAESGRLIAPEVADRRNLARTVVRMADAERLVLFHCPDTHLHLVLACERGRAGEVARRIEISLSHRGLRFDPARIRKVEGSWHLTRLARYVPGNSEHHGAVVDPLHEASSVLDLLGLRVVAHRTLARLQAALPRWRPARLLPLLGVEELRAGSDLRLLRESAASAVAVPALAGRTPPVIQARIAALHVGRRLGASTAALARLLDLRLRDVQRGLRRVPDPALVRAIELQLGLRERVEPVGSGAVARGATEPAPDTASTPGIGANRVRTGPR